MVNRASDSRALGLGLGKGSQKQIYPLTLNVFLQNTNSSLKMHS